MKKRNFASMLALSALIMTSAVGIASATSVKLAGGTGNNVTVNNDGTDLTVTSTGNANLTVGTSSTTITPITFTVTPSTFSAPVAGVYTLTPSPTNPGVITVTDSSSNVLIAATYAGGTFQFTNPGDTTGQITYTGLIYTGGSLILPNENDADTYGNTLGFTLQNIDLSGNPYTAQDSYNFQESVTATPEPASFATLGIGAAALLMLGLATKRRSKVNSL